MVGCTAEKFRSTVILKLGWRAGKSNATREWDWERNADCMNPRNVLFTIYVQLAARYTVVNAVDWAMTESLRP